MLERALFIYVFSGANVRDVFQNEEGVHSWHCPTNRKKGRVHTSSITVVILDEKHYEDVNLK
jgi:protein subunit release factor A